jgi:SAM-dependent methyltransferase
MKPDSADRFPRSASLHGQFKQTVTSTVPFFVVGTARSGTTSLAEILNTARNGRCASEPSPNLNVETREMMDGRLADPVATLELTVLPRVRKELARGDVYGEKNVTYGPFVRYLHQALGGRFAWVVRDGRDVVTSLINWHDKKFGSVYRECGEPENLSAEALKSAANLPVHLDASDYSRPRPQRDAPLGREWEGLSRAEMCAYYWSTINALCLDEVARLPEDAWTRIDYTAPSVEEVLRVARFCGLEGLPRDKVQALLDKRINSLEDRGVAGGDRYPHWTEWDGGMRRRFDRLAAPMMVRLGYYGEPSTRWRPREYGTVWKSREPKPDWYAWMYNGRRRMHEDLLAWIASRDRQGDEIASVMDFGCGIGEGYSEALAGKRYVGVDLSPDNIAWCAQHRHNENHRYICVDFIAERLNETADLVFSSGTIDNAYDPEAYLAAMMQHSKKWVQLTCYRGWFPDLPEHRFSYSREHGCFYNDLSVTRLVETLESLGCSDITAGPARTDGREIPFETRITARVPARKPEESHV